MDILTILTPTYNRAELLKNCFASLCAQTAQSFEWLIVDDGSTDDTKAVVASFARLPHDFPIRYVYKPNGGKHTALNYAHEYIEGKYLLILDSDDTLTPDAVETVLQKWQQYADDASIWCVSFQRGIDLSTPICRYERPEDFISDYLNYRVNQKVDGDCAEVVRSDIFRQYRFPEFPGERFLGEDCMWLTVAQKYRTVYCSKIIYLCEYLEGGLTKGGRKMRLQNPLGGMFRCNLYLNRKVILSERMKKAILYDCYALVAGDCKNHVREAAMLGLCRLCMPLGWLFYRKWSC